MMSALLSPALTPTGLIKKTFLWGLSDWSWRACSQIRGGFSAELKKRQEEISNNLFFQSCTLCWELLLVGNVDDGGILEDWQAERDTSYFIQLWTCSWFSPSTVSHSTISLVHSHSLFAYFSSFPLRLTIYWVFPLFLNCLPRKMFPLSGN